MPSDEVEKVPEDASTQDVDMDQGEQSTQAEAENPTESGDRAPPATMDAADDVDAEADPDPVEERKTFASSLMSPVVTLIVGKEEPALLQAHQAFLVRSPYFEDICSKFAEDGSVRLPLLPVHGSLALRSG